MSTHLQTKVKTQLVDAVELEERGSRRGRYTLCNTKVCTGLEHRTKQRWLHQCGVNLTCFNYIELKWNQLWLCFYYRVSWQQLKAVEYVAFPKRDRDEGFYLGRVRLRINNLLNYPWSRRENVFLSTRTLSARHVRRVRYQNGDMVLNVLARVSMPFMHARGCFEARGKCLTIFHHAAECGAEFYHDFRPRFKLQHI